MGKVLVIVEVSQKQAYIFGSNKLKDNIQNSDIIAYVTGNKYFKECYEKYDRDLNEVYCGGGHAVLQFESEEEAKTFVTAITLAAHKRFEGLELFAKIYTCKDSESLAEGISELIKQLEKKKALRRASFSQGTFGVEDIDSATRTVKKISINKENSINDTQDKIEINGKKYQLAYSFENLGGSKNESNFIAVVHIDGNAMGKRVEQIRSLYGKKEWDSYRDTLKNFSDAIDSDFKTVLGSGDIDHYESGKINQIQSVYNSQCIRHPFLN